MGHANDWADIFCEQGAVFPRFCYLVNPHTDPQLFDPENPDDEWTTTSAEVVGMAAVFTPPPGGVWAERRE